MNAIISPCLSQSAGRMSFDLADIMEMARPVTRLACCAVQSRIASAVVAACHCGCMADVIFWCVGAAVDEAIECYQT